MEFGITSKLVVLGYYLTQQVFTSFLFKMGVNSDQKHVESIKTLSPLHPKRKSERIRHKVFPLLPLLRYFRALGAIPFGEDASGLKFSAVSWPMVYCVVMTTVQWLLSHHTTVHSSFYRGLFSGFDQFIRSSMGLIYVGYVIKNLVSWVSTPAVVKAVNSWLKLQAQLDSVSLVKPSPSFLLDHPRSFVVAMVAVAVLEQTISFIRGPFRTVLLLNFFFAMQHHMMFTWFWIGFPHMVLVRSENLKESLLKAVRLGGAEVRRHREIWDQLLARTRQLTGAVASTTMVWLLMRLAVIVLSMYASAVYQLKNRGEKPMPTYLFTPILRSILDLVIACELSHRANTKIIREFKLAILSIKIQRLPFATQDELQLFLCSLDRSGNPFNLQGIFKLNRKTFLSVTSLTLTYITVLVQLKQLPTFN